MNTFPLLASTRRLQRPAPPWRVALGTLVFATAAVLVAPSAQARGHADHGPMMAMGMHGGTHGGMGGRMSERMLDAVNATAEQKTQVRAILEAARSEREKSAAAQRELRDKAAALFAQPVVDAAAAESLRQQMNAQHEQQSRRMMQVMLDVSRVLTPEQRAEMARRMKARGEMAMRHHAERSQMDGHGRPAAN